VASQAIKNAVIPSPAMKRKGKLGHNDGTQTPIEPMPKHPHVFRRDGRCYYLPHLHKSIYRHKGTAMGYGLKLGPEDFAKVKDKAPKALVLEGL
jgi:hypothetical protein